MLDGIPAANGAADREETEDHTSDRIKVSLRQQLDLILREFEGSNELFHAGCGQGMRLLCFDSRSLDLLADSECKIPEHLIHLTEMEQEEEALA